MYTSTLEPAIMAQVGFAADPGIETLLDKVKLAQIKIRKIDMAINDLQTSINNLQSGIGVLEMQRDMLVQEYNIPMEKM